MGYTTQLFIALVYKTGTKSMLRQSSSTLVKYVNYLIVISININENCRREKICQKEKQGEKRCRKFISQNSFTHLFNIQMTKFINTQPSIYGVIVYILLCHGSLNYCPVNIFDYWLALYHGLASRFAIKTTQALIDMCHNDARVRFVYNRRRCATKVKMSHASAIKLQ